MRFKGHRLQAETFRIDIEIFIGDKKEIVFLSCTKAAQSRKNDVLLLLENFFHPCHKIRQSRQRHFLADIIYGCIQSDQQTIAALSGTERKLSVRRCYSITFIRKRSRDSLCYKSPQPRKIYPIMIQNQFFNHLRQKIYIHIQTISRQS